MKKRFLFVMVEGGGNVPAQMSIARRLGVRGHEVHVLGDRALAPDAVAAGCRFHSFDRAPQHHMRDKASDRLRDWEPSTPMAQLRRVGRELMFGPAEAYARDVLDAVDRVRPDAVAVDCLLFGAAIAAEKTGLPAALLFHFPYSAPVAGSTPFGLGLRPARTALGRLRDRVLVSLMKRMFRSGLAPVNDARTALGLAPLDDVFDQFHALPRTLVLTSREYDFVPSGLPENVRYVGPQLDDPPWPARWSSPWTADEKKPLVLVSLGSTYQRQERALTAIASGLGRLPVRGLVTLGALEPMAAPDNVMVVGSAPHAAVLPLASAVVCHGGHGTVMKALAHGLPVVCMPFGRDQRDNGVRVEVAGAGLSLSPGASAARVAKAVRRVLEEPAFREGARQMARIIERDVEADRAVAEMEGLAGAEDEEEPGRPIRAA
jgi:MGT family glycosyltransferase